MNFFKLRMYIYSTDWMYQLKNAIKFRSWIINCYTLLMAIILERKLTGLSIQKASIIRFMVFLTWAYYFSCAPKQLMTGQIGDGAAHCSRNWSAGGERSKGIGYCVWRTRRSDCAYWRKLLLGECDYFLKIWAV